jgi:hypothetical protein
MRNLPSLLSLHWIHRRVALLCRPAIWLLFSLLLCLLLPGQEFRGTFSGVVRDAQGAGIPRAKIIAIETQTGTKTETVAEDSGAYTIPFLMPGKYEISVEAQGFQKYVRSGLTLGAGDHPVVDIRLDVRTVQQAVTVTAESPLIQAANATVGQIITSKEVENLPVNGRTPLMLADLALGAMPAAEPGTQVRPFDNGTTFSFTLGGVARGNTEMLYNGAPNAGFSNVMAYSPPQDAVQEVQVSIFDVDASFGHSEGGTINQVTKSGTNELHGALYEFNQVSALAANQFFYNALGVPRPAYRYNQYGATASGPVWLPKIFNGRNRVFWLFAWEGLKDSDPANSPRETPTPVNFATVPTDAERQGDFSALLKANKPGTDYTIYDPGTGVVSGNQVARKAFPNNIIPASRLNPVALKLLQYFPEPNLPGQINGFQNYLVNAIDSDNYDNELARVDVNITSNNKLSADFHHNYRAQDKNNYFTNLSQGNYLWRRNFGSSLDDIYTISPTLFLDVRGSWTHYEETLAGRSVGKVNPTDLGFPSYIAANSEGYQIPYIVFTSATVSAGSQPSFQSLGLSGGSSYDNLWDSFQLFSDVVKVHGNHTIKVGTDIRDYRWSAFTLGNSSGTYTFTSAWTNGPLSNAAAAPLGQDFAAFLLGLPSSGSIALDASSATYAHYYSGFIQDDWRATSTFTLNLGLRLEHETPAYERYNRAVNGFDPTAQNGIAAAAAAAYAAHPVPQIPPSQFNPLGGLTFPGPGNRALYQTESYPVSPRLGFAWAPARFGGSTVIRGGVASFAVPIGIAGSAEQPSIATLTLNQEGFSQTTQFVATGNNYLSPSATLSDPFPNGVLHPSGASAGAATFLGQSISFFEPQVRNPYYIRWNFGVQRQLPGSMVLEVAYIGSHALHLPINTQLNYIPRQYLSTSIFRDQNTINLLNGSVANPFYKLLPGTSLNGSTVALQQLLVAYPQFPVSGVTLQGNGAGSSYYESLNVRLQKRFTNGLTLINNFIYSSLIERLAYLNDSDPAPEKRVSSLSQPLREVLGATYELPVGRGKALDLQSRLANALIGGWNLNGILTLQSGPVIGPWGNVIYLGGPLHFNPNQPNGAAFDTTQFVTASSLQPADNIRYFDTQFGNLRRAASKNLDFSVSKNFVFTERTYLQFRIETFNTTNHVTFGAPNISPTSTSFGQITSQANSPRAVQLGARLVW